MEEGDLLGMYFLLGEFPIGMEVSGGELFRGNFTWGEFTRICIKNVCYLSFFSLLIPLYMWRHFEGNLRGKFPAE